nr:hypothetical protein HmN_000959400 [Hymenolepis microstoma]
MQAAGVSSVSSKRPDSSRRSDDSPLALLIPRRSINLADTHLNRPHRTVLPLKLTLKPRMYLRLHQKRRLPKLEDNHIGELRFIVELPLNFDRSTGKHDVQGSYLLSDNSGLELTTSNCRCFHRAGLYTSSETRRREDRPDVSRYILLNQLNTLRTKLRAPA